MRRITCNCAQNQCMHGLTTSGVLFPDPSRPVTSPTAGCIEMSSSPTRHQLFIIAPSRVLNSVWAYRRSASRRGRVYARLAEEDGAWTLRCIHNWGEGSPPTHSCAALRQTVISRSQERVKQIALQTHTQGHAQCLRLFRSSTLLPIYAGGLIWFSTWGNIQWQQLSLSPSLSHSRSLSLALLHFPKRENISVLEHASYFILIWYNKELAWILARDINTSSHSSYCDQSCWYSSTKPERFQTYGRNQTVIYISQGFNKLISF